MKALRLAVVPKDKQTLDAKCKEWLTRAEKIKEAKNWQPTTATTTAATTTTTATTGVEGLSTLARSLPPVSTRKLTTREEIILLESAKLNGFIFPPWTNAPKLDEFQQETFLYVFGGDKSGGNDRIGIMSLLIGNSIGTSLICTCPACSKTSLRAGNDPTSYCS